MWLVREITDTGHVKMIKVNFTNAYKLQMLSFKRVRVLKYISFFYVSLKIYRISKLVQQPKRQSTLAIFQWNWV